VALGEFVEGVADPETTTRFLESVADILPLDREIALLYAGVARRLRREGRLIGGNDLWIACTALRHGDALVTRNTSEFARIEGLRVIGY
jgi:tRNA(fMet)-specific endonuclease VapC